MNGPGTPTLVVIGSASALCFAAAVAFLVHTFSTLPERAVETAAPRPAPARPRPGALFPDFKKIEADLAAREGHLSRHEESLLAKVRALNEHEEALKSREARRLRGALDTVDWQQRLADAPDLAAFMSEAVPIADAGNTRAQFAVYLALTRCREQMRDPLAKPEARARCATLARSGIQMRTDAARWLDRSATADYPPALAQRSLDRIAEGVTARITRAEREQQLRDAEADLVHAMKSQDPAVTWMAAHGVGMLYHQDPRAQRGTWFWRLVACEQGFPCGSDAPWLPELCARHRDCRDGESGRDYILRQVGSVPKLAERARMFAALMGTKLFDAGKLAASVRGLPEPVSPDAPPSG